MGSNPADFPAEPTKLINLQLGWPTPALFASDSILEGAQQVLTSEEETSAALIYGPHIGHPPLRKSLATWLSTVYSTPVDFGRICITNGASGNLANVLQRFTDPLFTRKIFMVEPTYFLACPIFEDNGFAGKLKGVPEGINGGLDPEFLRHELEVAERAAREASQKNGLPDAPILKVGKAYPKVYKYVIYVVPTFSNPSGKTMSVDMRQELVGLAREFDALIVSDDVYDFLAWPADPSEPHTELAIPPRLVDIDRQMDGYSEWGNTISNGSFSKIIGPGIRVGWADCAPSFASQLAETGSSSSGGAPSHLTSTFVDKMLRGHKLQSHIRDTLIPTYRRRYYALNTAITKHLSPLGVKVESNSFHDGNMDIAGGFFTYLRLPDDLPPAKVVASFALSQHKLRIAFGHMFVVSGDETSTSRAEAKEGFSQCIRLCWAWHDESDIQEGVKRLSSSISDIRALARRGEKLETSAIGIR